ncbi:hypothetical protein HDU87_004814 [Geranomyces variabilis]|uniref:Calponin-homology (CH) domain-containing protein n=1 Tax=Geranomyces variabilis TaxID=109894 RepID=A0AAD5THU6_9FUNG|nr:hypothetical protein HDU87_004814 [Geranomyces variabilis]
MDAPKISRPPVTTTTDHSELNDATHSVTDTEVEIFTSWINESCADSPEVADRLPLDPKTRQLFSACKDSWLLVALIDNARPGLVEKTKMHMHGSIKALNAFELAENANVVIDAARKLGVVVVNIGAEDITGGNQHLILGIIWQIVRGVLSKNLYVVMNPRILRLQKAGESFENLLRVTPEDTLLRWVNQTLSTRRGELKSQYRLVRNFGKDLQDGIVLTYMMQILYPEAGFEGLQLETDVRVRVTKLVERILEIGLKYITVDSIVSGNPRTNFAFLAQLFSVRPALAELSTAESQQFDAMLSVAKLDLDGLGGVVDLAAEQKRRMSIRSSVSRGDWQASARRQSFRDVLANEPGPVAKEREVERFWQRSPFDNVQPKPWMASWTPPPFIPQLDDPKVRADAEAAERAAIRERERHAPITCQRCQQCRHSEAALGTADSHDKAETERRVSTDSCEHDEDDGSVSSQDVSADASAESLDATSRGVGTTEKGDASAAAKALMEVAEKLKRDEKKASKKARRHARLVEARRQREAEAAAEEEARQAAKAQKAAAKEEERRAEEARHAEARRQREAEEEAKAAEAAAEHEARLAAKAQKAAAKEEERRAEEARQAAKAAAKEEERLAEEARLAAKAAAKDEERRAEEERLAAKAAAKEEARRAEEARQAAKAAAREQETAGERDARLARKEAKQAARLQESVAEEEARLAAKAAKAAARDAARQREREEEEARAAAKQAQKDGARSSELQEAVAAEETRRAAKAAKAAAKLQEEEARREAKLQEEEARREAKLQEEEKRRAAKDAKAAEREASRSQELQEAAAAEEARLAAKEARRAAKDAKASEREASRSQELQEAAAAEEARLAAKEAGRREQEEEAAAAAASRAAALEAKSRLEAELEALRQAKRAAEAALKEQEEAGRKAAKEQEEAARKAAKSTRSVAAAADRSAATERAAADRPAPAIEATSTESLADQAVAASWGPGGSAGGDPLERESLAAAWAELKRREQALASERALFEQEKAAFTKEVESRRAAWSVIKTVTTTIHYLDDSCGECRERVRAQQRTQEQQPAVSV